jgi:AcrR family transcriptional regulator
MPHLAGHLHWVHPPRQSRSQETLERLLDAAESVLSEKGFVEASVAEIAARAKSSVGAFYSRFQDKHTLLRCLHERFVEDAIATADAALDPELWEEQNIGEILGEVIPFLVRIYEERRSLISAFIVQCTRDPSYVESGGRLQRHLSLRLRQLLLARRHELAHPDPELAVDFGLRLVMHMLDISAMYAPKSLTEYELSGSELARELCRAYLGYLGVERTL